MRFAGIVPSSPITGNPVDLVVSVSENAADPYLPANSSFNGKWTEFMQINVRDNTQAFLDFSFYDSVTGDAVELEEFFITVYDVDQQIEPSKQREQFCVDSDDLYEYILSNTSNLLVEEQASTCAGEPGSSIRFSSTEAGFLCDNPSSSKLDIVTCDECRQCLEDEERLGPFFPIDQSARAVTLAFAGPQTKFSLVLEVVCEDCNVGQARGRNFRLGGKSTLCDVRVWDVCNEEIQNNLEIEGAPIYYNNLGGQGPKFDDPLDVILFEEVVTESPDSANPVDLLVSVTDGTESYQVANSSFNGKWDQFMQINVLDNSRAFLDFAFYDSVTREGVNLENFVITVYDLDQQVDAARQRERFCIDTDQFYQYILSEDSSVLVEELSESCSGGVGSSVRFSSTEAGFLCDNPGTSTLESVSCNECQQCLDDYERLSPYFPIDQSARAVTLAFTGPQQKFSIMLESLCDHDCLTNEGRPRGRNFLFGGRSSLCEPRVWDVCDEEIQNNLEIEGAAIQSNNLGGQGPKFDDPLDVIVFEEVVTESPDSANPVDLVVSVTDGTESYQVANSSFNGKWDQFMQINVLDNSRAFLDFAFFDSVTGGGVNLENFVITVYDLDQQVDAARQRERFCID
ncbi:hypothetical protein CTAYLR_008357, partial [Chrysophaeum taylorii]